MQGHKLPEKGKIGKKNGEKNKAHKASVFWVAL